MVFYYAITMFYPVPACIYKYCPSCHTHTPFLYQAPVHPSPNHCLRGGWEVGEDLRGGTLHLSEKRLDLLCEEDR